ncbi:MAG: polyphenol oxidase [Rhodobacteraceae bacterium]|nr:polyphenol oxidase [Paracoccaceae bacterium]|tara:strand:+ start:160 stop:918 length:759 start_codon:yes stop_codon:yes gene_type:complete
MTPPNLKSYLLNDFCHGFFLRQGGLSSGQFESLNCDLKSLDDKHAVLANREIVANNMGVTSESLITLKQIHSSKVIKIESKLDSNTIEGDGMVTAKKGVVLGILTADCAPILFAEKKASVIGVAHAGWRGAFDSIIENIIRKMTELGAKENHIVAAIGPCIQKENYEVGPEFLERFVRKNSKSKKFFNIDNNQKIWFDLPGFILEKLKLVGVKSTNNLAKCTFSLSNDFFSHRRNKKNSLNDCGRMISTIRL